MSFLNPQFLFALSAVAIPIIIHLFHFRRFKTLYFTNVRFLKEIKQETATRSNLKQLLILLSRILTIIFLVLAFAQPFIPAKEDKGSYSKKAVSIFLDNSFSMNTIGEEGTYFDEAKQKAREILNAYPPDTKIQILSNDFEGKQQHLGTKEQALDIIDDLGITSSIRVLSNVISRQKLALSADEAEPVVYLISDFQKTIADLDNIERDSSLSTYFIPVRSKKQHNVFIDSCWFEVPVLQAGHVTKIITKVTNISEEPVNKVRLVLSINEVTKTMNTIDMGANETVLDTLSFTISDTGWQSMSISINDYPIAFDDTYFIAYEVLPSISILAITDKELSVSLSLEDPGIKNESIKYLDALFSSDPYFNYEKNHTDQLNYNAFSGYQLIILNSLKEISSGLASELKKYVEGGGSLMVFPNSDINIESYKQFMFAIQTNYYNNLDIVVTSVEKINIDADIFFDVFDRLPENLDLPVVNKRFVLTKHTKTNEEVLLTFKDNTAFVAKYKFGKGKIYLSAVPLMLEFSNLPTHAIFVPMMYKIAILSSNPQAHSYTMGKNDIIEIANKSNQGDIMFTMKKGDYEFIPEQRARGIKTLLFLHNMINEAGIFEISRSNQEQVQSFAAFNFDRRESDLSVYDMNELKEVEELKGIVVIESLNKNITKILSELNQGKALWKLCIIFALIFIAIEIALIKIM